MKRVNTMSLSKKDLDKIRNIPDSEIDYSDIPELDDKFWKNARVIMPAKKRKISVRVDNDIIKWFKAKGKGYQSMMNAVLRSYVETHKKGDITWQEKEKALDEIRDSRKKHREYNLPAHSIYKSFFSRWWKNGKFIKREQ